MTKKHFSFVIHTLILLTGLYLLVCGIIMALLGAMTAGVYLSIFTGIFLIAVTIFSKQISSLCKNKFFATIRIFFIICLSLALIMTIIIAVYGNTDTVNYNEDAVIVLGAGLRGDKITYPLAYRLDRAVEYLNINQKALAVVSGGKGSGETVTEAYAMKKYITERGIDPLRIITEEKSTSTSENLRFSKEILDKTLENGYTCAVITNRFHVLRASLMAKKVGLNATHAGAKIQPYSVPVNYLRELAALLKYFLLGY